MLLFHGCNIFSCFWDYSFFGNFTFPALFVVFFFSGSFVLVFIFHCWRYPQMPSDSWLSVYREFKWLKAVYEWAGLSVLGFILTNNQVASCFFNCSCFWMRWAGLGISLAAKLCSWVDKGTDGSWCSEHWHSLSPSVFSIEPLYHHHSPSRPSSKSNWDFGSISPEKKPPVFG